MRIYFLQKILGSSEIDGDNFTLRAGHIFGLLSAIFSQTFMQCGEKEESLLGDSD